MKRITLSLVLLSLLGVQSASAQFGIVQARERARRIQCSSYLSQFGKGLIMYSMDNDERFPSDLGRLLPYFGQQTKLFVCPSSGHTPGDAKTFPEWTDYVLFPGLTAASDPHNLLVACRPENHNYAGVNVLYIDGSVIWRPLDTLRGELKAQGVRPPTVKAASVTPNIKQLIAQLGARDFKVRKAAEGKLRAVGTPATAAIEAATQHEDPEISSRAKKLLQTLKPQARSVSGLLTHKVRPGDTLASIAKLWGVTIEQLTKANDIQNDDPAKRKTLIIPVD